MKKSELKKILKPLIKECIKEALLEDGILSGIIAEVASGLTSSSLMTEQRQAATDLEREAELEDRRRKTEAVRQQRIKRLNESTSSSFGGINIFEGTTPLSSKDVGHAEPSHGALSGVEPSDPGVDIRGLAALAGGNWKKMMEKKFSDQYH